MDKYASYFAHFRYMALKPSNHAGLRTSEKRISDVRFRRYVDGFLLKKEIRTPTNRKNKDSLKAGRYDWKQSASRPFLRF
jgi:hypothetical protein